MLHLEHLNLVVNDISAALEFYRAAFPHWRVREEGESTWSEKPRKWLHFGDDYQYLTFNDNGEGDNRDLSVTGLKTITVVAFFFGFLTIRESSVTAGGLQALKVTLALNLILIPVFCLALFDGV